MFRVLCVTACLAAAPALADAPLGLNGASVTLGYALDEAGDGQLTAAVAVVDVALTANHGFQGDLRFEDTSTGGIGTLGAHLYLAPNDAHRFGLFTTLSDVDGRARVWGTLGAEGGTNLTPTVSTEWRAGIGYGSDGMDFIFAGGGISATLTDNWALSGHLDLADFDEADLRATSVEGTLTLTFRPQNSGLRATFTLSDSMLTGRDSAASETRAGIGITFDVGSTTVTPTFRTPDPAAPLIRRGLW